METLYTKSEFNMAKSIDLLPCKCKICDKIYYKLKRVIQRGNKGYCSPKCQGVERKKEKIYIPKKCEYCNKEQDGSYASGRFCSSKCAHGFVSKEKRKEINEKVSLKLKGSISPFKEIKKIFKEKKKRERILKEKKEKKIRICDICSNSFIGNFKKTCSRKCGSVLAGLKQKGKQKGNKLNYKNNGGLRVGGGRSKVYDYESPIAGLIKINREEIRVAKVLDKLNLKWKRNTNGFSYLTLDGKNRKYYPDFYLEDYDVYVEFKGWVTDEMTHKMTDASIKNNLKLIIIYSDSKRYRKLGLNIEMLEKDNLILLNKLKL